MKSFFTVEPKKKAVPTLAQLRAALEKASAHSLSVVSERWPASSSSFAPRKDQTQSMNGGCGGLWMELHGHTAAYGVAAFNNKGVWDRAISKDGTKLKGKELLAAQERFRASLIRQLQQKWEEEERGLLDSVDASIINAEVIHALVLYLYSIERRCAGRKPMPHQYL